MASIDIVAGKFIVKEIGFSNIENEIGVSLAKIFRDKIYRFNAERLNVSRANTGTSQLLAVNASNLAEVISNLESINPNKFKRFIKAVNIVLPSIKYITVPKSSQLELEIFLWPIEISTERNDLAISLLNSGTGVGQILAILYVVINSDEPQTIIIDEPQSFLHPGAVRKLIAVLKEHPHHQYILATHSPTVIGSSKPSTITMITQHKGRSKLKESNPAETQELSELLSEVGARLSDVFGADKILWVEGMTEELCFPIILDKVAKINLMGTALLGVQNTGDFEGRRSELILQVYEKLTSGKSLLPPAQGFIFDPEQKTRQKKDDLIRMSKNKASFLQRRLYENYLLDSLAITYIINNLENFSSIPIDVNEIQTWLEQSKKDTKYGESTPELGATWTSYVHGANVLKDLFTHFSNGQYSFDKVTHSVQLTEWLCDNKPEVFEDLVMLLKKRLE